MSHYINFATFADYKTTEVNTGVKWIDGKPIYKKTVNIGALPNVNTKNVPHNITGINRVVKIEAFCANETNHFVIPHADPSQGVAALIRINVTAINVVIVTGTDRTNYSGYATVFYTKTTD